MNNIVYYGNRFKVELWQSYDGEEVFYVTIFYDGRSDITSYTLEDAIKNGNE